MTRSAARPAPHSAAARVAVAALLASACGGGVEPHAPGTGADIADEFWALTTNHATAVISTVAPYDTVSLAATPRDAHGDPLEGVGRITYQSTLPSTASVDADGLVRAHAPGTAEITAKLSVGEVSRGVRVYVVVTAEPPPEGPTLSIAPLPPDSTTVPIHGTALDGIAPNGTLKVGFSPGQVVFPRITDAHGQPVPVSPWYQFRVGDPAILGTGLHTNEDLLPVLLFGALRPGRTAVTAVTTFYGTPLADTVEFTAIQPVMAAVRVMRRQVRFGEPPRIVFEPEETTISPGGTVLWANIAGEAVDVVFENPESAAEHGTIISCAGNAVDVVDAGGTGNIPAFGVPQDPKAERLSVENCRSRRFTSPGVYRFHSPTTGATGRIVVDRGVSDS